MKWWVIGLLVTSFVCLCSHAVDLYRAERLRGGR
jgi:hypothetical protein